MPPWPPMLSAEPTRPPARAIYAPIVEDGATSFEERRRTGGSRVADRGSRRSHPWLVAEDGGRIVGFAYACPHRSRPAYRWAVDVSVYVDPGHQGQGLGRASTRPCSPSCASAASGSPARASPCPTRRASPSTRPRLRAGRRLPRDRLEGGRLARRRLVAARAQPGRRGPPGRAGLSPPASLSTIAVHVRERDAVRHSPRTTSSRRSRRSSTPSWASTSSRSASSTTSRSRTRTSTSPSP